MKSCAVCKDEYESYQINGLGCCSTKYCNMCYDHVVKLPKCSVCKKPNRHLKPILTVDELISSMFPGPIGFTSEITYDFDWFKDEFINVCEKNKDDRFDDLIRVINLIEDDQEHSHNIVKEFSFVVEVNNEDTTDATVKFDLVVNEKIFHINSRYVSEFDQMTAVERQYMVLGSIIASFKGTKYNDSFKMLEALLT